MPNVLDWATFSETVARAGRMPERATDVARLVPMALRAVVAARACVDDAVRAVDAFARVDVAPRATVFFVVRAVATVVDGVARWVTDVRTVVCFCGARDTALSSRTAASAMPILKSMVAKYIKPLFILE